MRWNRVYAEDRQHSFTPVAIQWPEQLFRRVIPDSNDEARENGSQSLDVSHCTLRVHAPGWPPPVPKLNRLELGPRRLRAIRRAEGEIQEVATCPTRMAIAWMVTFTGRREVTPPWPNVANPNVFAGAELRIEAAQGGIDVRAQAAISFVAREHHVAVTVLDCDPQP